VEFVSSENVIEKKSGTFLKYVPFSRNSAIFVPIPSNLNSDLECFLYACEGSFYMFQWVMDKLATRRNHLEKKNENLWKFSPLMAKRPSFNKSNDYHLMFYFFTFCSGCWNYFPFLIYCQIVP